MKNSMNLLIMNIIIFLEKKLRGFFWVTLQIHIWIRMKGFIIFRIIQAIWIIILELDCNQDTFLDVWKNSPNKPF